MSGAGVDISLHEIGESATAVEGRVIAVSDIDIDWYICGCAVISDLDVSIDRGRGHGEVMREHYPHCKVALQVAEGYSVCACGEPKESC